MKLVIDISGYNAEWIRNAYGIPQEINTNIAESIINAEPYSDWISVTERLPETDMYRTLTTIRTPHKGTNVRSGHFYKGFFFNDNGDTWNATDKEVIAWMPLPEPYKEVTT